LPTDYKTQLQLILDDMRSVGVRHNDIVKSYGVREVMVQDGKLSLIDFGWASVNGSWSCEEGIPDSHPSELEKFNDTLLVPALEIQLKVPRVSLNKTVTLWRKQWSIRRLESTWFNNSMIELWNRRVKIDFTKAVLQKFTHDCKTVIVLLNSAVEVLLLAQWFGYTHVDGSDRNPKYILGVSELVSLKALDKAVYSYSSLGQSSKRNADLEVCEGKILNCSVKLDAILDNTVTGTAKILVIEWIIPNKIIDLNCSFDTEKQQYTMNRFELAIMKFESILLKEAFNELSRISYRIR